MRSVYVVCYDISDNVRLRRVYRTMRGFGDHIQLSVFRCELSARERVELIAALSTIIDHDQDQILLIDVGPAEGRASMVFEAVGRPYLPATRHAIVV